MTRLLTLAAFLLSTNVAFAAQDTEKRLKELEKRLSKVESNEIQSL